MKLMLLSLPPSSWMRNVKLAKMLLPYTLNAMPGDDLLDNIDRRQFRTYRYLSNSMIDVLMLFTYGIFCPFLTFIIVASIVFNELVNHLQVGSYLFDRSLQQSSNSNNSIDRIMYETSSVAFSQSHMSQLSVMDDSHSGDPKYPMQAIVSAVHSQQHSLDADAVESAQPQVLPPQPVQSNKNLNNKDKDKNNRLLLMSSIYLSNPHYLFFSMWRLVVFTILTFSTVILFDMIADVYSNVLGVISVLIFWFVMILAFYSRERLEKIIACISCKGYCCKRNEDLETDRSSIIEMNKSDTLRRSLI